MRYFQFLKDRPILISSDLLLLSRSRVALLGWPGFSNYHDPFCKAYWGLSFTMNRALSVFDCCYRISPEIVQQDTFWKSSKKGTRRLANRRTMQKPLAWLRRVATAVTDNHVQRAPQMSCQHRKPSAKSIGIKINICRIQITDFDMSKIQNLLVHSVFSMTTMVS